MKGLYTTKMFVKNGTLYKRCAFCGIVKPITCFSKNGVDQAGDAAYRQDCKVCYNARRRENRTRKRHSDFIGSMKRRGENPTGYTREQWLQAVVFFGGVCAYCGRPMRKGERLTRDHLVPVHNGGSTTASNIVPACRSCNSSKGASEWLAWFMKQSFYTEDRQARIQQWQKLVYTAGIK